MQYPLFETPKKSIVWISDTSMPNINGVNDLEDSISLNELIKECNGKIIYGIDNTNDIYIYLFF